MRCILAIGCLSLSILSGCGSTSLVLNDFLLNPDPQISQTPADYGYEYESRSVPVAEGRSVTIWHMRSKASKALIVLIPGASGNKSVYLVGLPMLLDNGYDAIFMDYEGFGDSPGEATLQHAADDALAVTGYAMTQHERVGVYGVSLGSPLAVRAAAEYEVIAVGIDGVLVLQDELGAWLQENPVRALAVGGNQLASQVPEDYDISRYIAQAHGAKLIMHSPEDTLTSFAGARKVYEAASPPKVLYQEYGNHGQMIFLLPDTYRKVVSTWLAQVIAQLDAAAATK